MNVDLFYPWADVLENEPMSRHTSFRIGGPARLFVTPHSEEGLVQCLRICRREGIRPLTVGNGTNLLVSDSGINGAVIHMGEGMNVVTVTGRKVRAGAGARLSDVCRAAAEKGLSGLEFAYGIPGSVGGGIFMNAGAYGGELKDVCVRVGAMTRELERAEYACWECGFGYRKSRFQQDGGTVTWAEFELTEADPAEIRSRMDEVLARRRDKQPLEYPSAGSVFRRPEGYFAGALIEEAGLKGAFVGGAQVSSKHAGFIINTGGATCGDVRALVELIQKRVEENSGVKLECEIRFVGDE